jgi:hypothetical protein
MYISYTTAAATTTTNNNNKEAINKYTNVHIYIYTHSTYMTSVSLRLVQ